MIQTNAGGFKSVSRQTLKDTIMTLSSVLNTSYQAERNKEQDKEIQNILDMKIHERINLKKDGYDYTSVLRVMSGWIYTNKHNNSVFVPLPLN